MRQPVSSWNSSMSLSSIYRLQLKTFSTGLPPQPVRALPAASALEAWSHVRRLRPLEFLRIVLYSGSPPRSSMRQLAPPQQAAGNERPAEGRQEQDHEQSTGLGLDAEPHLV